jgi:hypothetical protein
LDTAAALFSPPPAVLCDTSDELSSGLSLAFPFLDAIEKFLTAAAVELLSVDLTLWLSAAVRRRLTPNRMEEDEARVLEAESGSARCF